MIDEKNLIVKKNTLIESKFDLSVLELKLILILLVTNLKVTMSI